MNTQRIATIDTEDRLQLPHDWVESLGLGSVASLQITTTGILVRPATPRNWHEIFATKLPLGVGPAVDEEIEVREDDLLF
jgi:hypothetical protein